MPNKVEGELWLPKIYGKVDFMLVVGVSLLSGELYYRIKGPPFPSGMLVTSIFALLIYLFNYRMAAPLLVIGYKFLTLSLTVLLRDIICVFRLVSPTKYDR